MMLSHVSPPPEIYSVATNKAKTQTNKSKWNHTSFVLSTYLVDADPLIFLDLGVRERQGVYIARFYAETEKY